MFGFEVEMFNINYQKSHFCFYGLITKAGWTFTVTTTLIIVDLQHQDIHVRP
jgi:hypothetical protein